MAGGYDVGMCRASSQVYMGVWGEAWGVSLGVWCTEPMVQQLCFNLVWWSFLWGGCCVQSVKLSLPVFADSHKLETVYKLIVWIVFLKCHVKDLFVQ